MAVRWKRPLRRRAQVLICYSDRDWIGLARRRFRKAGLGLVSVGSAQAVYELTRRSEPAAIILGSHLSDESGFLACAKVKLEFPAIPVLLLSPTPSAEDRRFARFAGADGCVDASEGVPSLLRQIRKWVTVHSQA